MTARLDQATRLEKIELIDTFLEYASDIVTDMKGAPSPNFYLALAIHTRQEWWSSPS